MKQKLFLMLFALVISISAFSEPTWLKASGLSIKTNGVYEQYTPVNIDVCIDFERKQIIVYSKDVQIFDYVDCEYTKNGNYNMFQAQCSDTKYRRCIVSIVTSVNSITLYIDYNDFEYKYKLR